MSRSSLFRRLLVAAVDVGAEHLAETDDAPQFGGLALLVGLGALGLAGYAYLETKKGARWGDVNKSLDAQLQSLRALRKQACEQGVKVDAVRADFDRFTVFVCDKDNSCSPAYGIKQLRADAEKLYDNDNKREQAARAGATLVRMAETKLDALREQVDGLMRESHARGHDGTAEKLGARTLSASLIDASAVAEIERRRHSPAWPEPPEWRALPRNDGETFAEFRDRNKEVQRYGAQAMPGDAAWDSHLGGWFSPSSPTLPAAETQDDPPSPIPAVLGQCRASLEGNVVRLDAQTPVGRFVIFPIAGPPVGHGFVAFSPNDVMRFWPIVLAGKVVAAPSAASTEGTPQ